jgi:hypothetical protein
MVPPVFEGFFADIAIHDSAGLPDQLRPVIPRDVFKRFVDRYDGAAGADDQDAVTDRIDHGFPVAVEFLAQH